ncbi:uncharacterized protein N7515_002727 [Penicillium bovifimosum]|uniref:Myb-like domain-containing protein n=1 Tax=Penicillium bovifimosum TaxID=126998 RepID=A0A9W9L8C3_9EURO|nr:uncharacterized protein N7515_002727 [Penicillium bovifimosum]KAJ5143940.1 hypothetical protein N7515_002727 [Penicillium bovifimosum]
MGGNQKPTDDKAGHEAEKQARAEMEVQLQKAGEDSNREEGAEPSSSRRGAKPVRWNTDVDIRMLLTIQWACNKEGVKVPWERVAEIMGPKFTEGAIVQHLAKLRTTREGQGKPVPPPLKRSAALANRRSQRQKQSPSRPGHSKKRRHDSPEASDHDLGYPSNDKRQKKAERGGPSASALTSEAESTGTVRRTVSQGTFPPTPSPDQPDFEAQSTLDFTSMWFNYPGEVPYGGVQFPSSGPSPFAQVAQPSLPDPSDMVAPQYQAESDTLGLATLREPEETRLTSPEEDLLEHWLKVAEEME